MLVLDQSHFYPTSGGQENDTGFLTINGKEYTVVDVTKVGPCVMHEISPALDIKGSLEDMRVIFFCIFVLSSKSPLRFYRVFVCVGGGVCV